MSIQLDSSTVSKWSDGVNLDSTIDSVSPDVWEVDKGDRVVRISGMTVSAQICSRLTRLGT
jgi:hypothetical protein